MSGTELPRQDEFWRTQTPREARSRIVAALRLELLGPEAPEEQLNESPLTKYVTGTLAPFGTDVPEEERDDQLTGDGEDEEAGAVDFGPPVSQALTPSSIGSSFLVPTSTKKLRVIASWGDYRVEEVSEDPAPAGVPAEGEEQQSNSDAKDDKNQSKRRRRRLVWIRTPREYDSLLIALESGGGLKRQLIAEDDGVTLEHLCRQLGDHYAVSVFLVNRRERASVLGRRLIGGYFSRF